MIHRLDRIATFHRRPQGAAPGFVRPPRARCRGAHDP